MVDIFRFDDFVLDRRRFELRRAGALVPAEPLVLELLLVLLERPGEVLSRDALTATVWKGRVVADSTISTAVKWARKALGDSGREQRYIRTVRGRGIRFEVRPERGRPDAVDDERAPSPAASALALYVRPPIGTDDRVPDAATRAFRTRIGSVLARVPLLRIVTPFARADRAMDPRELRARCGVSHVLDVDVRRAADVLAIDVALGETRTGLQVWSRRVETPAGPADADVLLRETVRQLEPRLLQAMVTEMDARGGGTAPGSLLLRAVALLSLRGWHRSTFLEAAGTIERAIEMNPDCPLAHAHLALIKALGHRVGLLRDDERLIPDVISAAETALALDGRDSAVLGLVGCALADVGQVDRALPLLEKAVEVGPHNGHARTALGAALMMTGDHEAAVGHLLEGIALSPADSRLAVWGTALALAQLALGERDGALRSATDACREDDGLHLPRLALAGIHLVRGERDRAASAVRECLRTKPDLNRVEVACVLGDRLGEGVWSVVRSLTASRDEALD